jgi:diguanylate cyclase (GGDEF)-like protein
VRRSLALLALVLVPTASGVWIATLSDDHDGPFVAQQARTASADAASLMLHEQAIEARLVAVAADGDLERLADGVTGRAEQEIAGMAAAQLRGTDGSIVSGACMTRVADGRTTMLGTVAGAGDVASLACATDALVDEAVRSGPGVASRAALRAADGPGHLLEATAVPSLARGGSVLSMVIDLERLLESRGSGDPASTFIADRRSSTVLAAAMPEGEVTRPRQPGMYLRGILTSFEPTIDALGAAGWITSVASLWPTVDGSEAVLVRFTPRPPTPRPMGMVLGLTGLAAAAVIGVLLFARHLDRPYRELSEAQDRLAIMYREARNDALHDGLTGMGNHRAFRDELARQFELFERDGVPFALMLLDLDNLKVVNDRDGHAEGDKLLTTLATRMREAFRGTDRLFRTGGDEFAVIMLDTTLDDAVAIAGRLELFCKRPPAGEQAIGFSGGISAVPQFTRDVEQLYRQADLALYWAKRHGRGFVEVFDPERDHLPGQSGLIGLDRAIHEVIRLRALTPVFQPIVDLRSGAILGYEGLVRPAPHNPFPDPTRLFAAAAETGRTVELDLAALEVIAAGASVIDRDLIISVNLSPSTLEVKDFDSAWLVNTLRRHDITPERVILELTERDGIADLKRLRRNMTHLSEYGLRFAADDLGAGNAGLKLLSEVPFDIVKIDLSLVQEAARNTATWAVLRSVRDFAWRQNAIVIGEGVETAEQVAALRQLDIEIGQGFLLGHPLPLSSQAQAQGSGSALGRPGQGPARGSGVVTAPVLDGPYRLDGSYTPEGSPSSQAGPGPRAPVLRPLPPRPTLLSA